MGSLKARTLLQLVKKSSFGCTRSHLPQLTSRCSFSTKNTKLSENHAKSFSLSTFCIQKTKFSTCSSANELFSSRFSKLSGCVSWYANVFTLPLADLNFHKLHTCVFLNASYRGKKRHRRNGISKSFKGKPDVNSFIKKHRNARYSDLETGFSTLHGKLHPRFLRKADVNSILWKLKEDNRLKEAAKNEGLSGEQFEKSIYALRKALRKQSRQNTSIQEVMCAVNEKQAHIHDLFPFILKQANELYPLRNCNVENVKKISDLSGPPDLFPSARRQKRKIVYHAGPTNSGKTHAALERFRHSESGVYCAPLRLLAAEVYRRTNEAGVQCDLLTGEERQWAISPEEPSSHTACTVEMCSTKSQYQCAVIDEIQMMGDVKRGWAWTRALLGLNCEEVHVCGENTAIDMVKTIAKSCSDEFEVVKYERLRPLTVSPHLGANLSNVEPGDCVVAFSQRELFAIRQKIEKTTGIKCAIVYGGLPPATKIEQAAKFNNPQDEHKVLVASDAIGMGLNLNVKRIVFKTLEKYDGYSMEQLTPSHTKQIAGRAGRFGSDHPEGEVTTLYGRDFKTLRYLLRRKSVVVQTAGLAPTIEQIEMLSHHLPDANLAQLLDVFLKVVQLDGENYFMCDLESVQYIASLVEEVPLSIWEQYTISQAPIKKKPLSATAIIEFARYVSLNKELTSGKLKDMISWPPRMPRTLKSLQEIETLHEICDAYLWLSYRFPKVFIHQDKVRRMQMFVETVIGAAVTSNLKQSHFPKNTKQITEKEN